MIQEIQPSVWQIQSPEPGPSILILGGIHGNEKTGTLVVKSLRSRFASGDLSLLRGTLTLALGNLEAIELQTRGTEGRDLNRCFIETCEAAPMNDSYEANRATLLAPFVRNADITLDIHATSKPSTPFVCSLVTQEHARIYKWFASDIVLADPRFVLSGVPCTTDDYAGLHGKIGICYETGWADDVTRKEIVEASILAILAQEGLIGPNGSVQPSMPTQAYELTQSILLTEEGFSFAPGMGTHSFQMVTPQDCIGYRGTEPIYPAEESAIVFPKAPELWGVGKPVFYLAKRVQNIA